MSISQEFAVHLENQLGRQIVSGTLLSSSSFEQKARIRLNDGSSYFVKWSSVVPGDYYSVQARGLAELEIKGKMKLPTVVTYSCHSSDQPSYIILEFVTDSPKSSSSAKHWSYLGVSLANMHRICEEFHGLDHDNYLDFSKQSNKRYTLWSDFFINERLLPQLEMGQNSGWIDNATRIIFQNKLQKMQDLLSLDQAKPSLLHGDLWIGNVIQSPSGCYLVDPAIYYGSREADIAFSEMFSGFPKIFYTSYAKEFPFQDGYEQRKEVLNLYHIMNNATLFGGHYVDMAKQHLWKL